jgi:hypothetical protein
MFRYATFRLFDFVVDVAVIAAMACIGVCHKVSKSGLCVD